MDRPDAEMSCASQQQLSEASAPMLALSATQASSHSRPAAKLGPPVRVVERAVYRGPHLYSSTPMIRIQVDLGALEERPTNRLPGFTERLTALLPSLHQHG